MKANPPETAVNDRTANFLALLASSSTLVCCALPALLVTLGAGASLVSLVGVFPFLITLSRYKVYVSLLALLVIAVAGYANYRAYRAPCPADPVLGRACMRARKRSRMIYYTSVVIFLFATIFTYIVPYYI